MGERSRILLSSIGTMMIVSASTAAIAITVLYSASLEQQRSRLAHIVQHRALLIKTVARFDTQSGGQNLAGRAGTDGINQILEVFKSFVTFEKTGEFSLGRVEGDQIVWLLAGQDVGSDPARSIPFDSESSDPMQRALRGESGTLVGTDYRGTRVLAAYEAIPEFGWGAVAKIDTAEVNRAFMHAGPLAVGIAFVIAVGAIWLMLRVRSPWVQPIEARVAERTAELAKANESLRTQIQERKEAEAGLRRMSKVFMDAATPILIRDMSGRIIDLNADVERTYGWTRAELLGQSLENLVPPEWRAQQKSLVVRCLEGGPVRNVESMRQTKSGERVPILLTLSLLTDEKGEPVAVASIAKDLSQQKRLQHQLQAAAAEAALTEARERRKLASDVHDGLGHVLALASMKLGMLRSSAENFGLDREVREVEQLVAEAHERTSSLSFQLSPPLLHDMGLAAAAQWLADDMQQRFGLEIAVEDDGQCPSLDEVTRITLFRGMSELLLNIAKHARADKARVRLWREDRFMRIAVEDDGVGFVPGADTKGYGLFSIRERLNHLGGSLEIQSAPGEGTKIFLTAPIPTTGSETDTGSA
jgi:PAS domain S-box-containing protein